MPITKVLKRDSVVIGCMLHVQQNDERTAERAEIEDWSAADQLTFRSDLVQGGERECDGRSLASEARAVPIRRIDVSDRTC